MLRRPVPLLPILLAPPLLTAQAEPAAGAEKPNFILVLADDLGYGDLGCYGNSRIRTPHIDRIAEEGIRFTNFYAQTVCGPSRAALMTGCYPLRVQRQGNRMDIHPRLHLDEITIAEVLRGAGYATGCFGKWDLAGHSQNGYAKELLPTRQGFDTFFGTPTSNDAVVHLLRDEEVIERRADMATLTQRYTDAALAFVREHKDRPFFVYIPHTMPHTRLAASGRFRGKSKRGLYGDVVEELDWNVGRILAELRALSIDRRTYLVFLSDNGPWWIKKKHGGSAGPLRGAKTSAWEGGVRVPCVVRAPGRVPAGKVCDAVASTLDLLPTLAALAGVTAPDDRVIDGNDIRGLLRNPDSTSPTKVLYHFVHTHLQALRAGRYKLHLPRPARPGWTPPWARHIAGEDVFAIEKPLLFDLQSDPGERRDIAGEHLQLVAELLALAERGRAEIGDHDRIGTGARFVEGAPRRPDIARWKRGEPLFGPRSPGRKK